MTTTTGNSYTITTTGNSSIGSAIYGGVSGLGGSGTIYGGISSRPTSPKVGDMYYNPSTYCTETWDGTSWIASVGGTTIGTPGLTWHTYPGTTTSPTWIDTSYSNSIDWSAGARIEKRLAVIEERLAILTEDKEGMEKFPALKEAYEHYKMIERLCKGNSE